MSIKSPVFSVVINRKHHRTNKHANVSRIYLYMPVRPSACLCLWLVCEYLCVCMCMFVCARVCVYVSLSFPLVFDRVKFQIKQLESTFIVNI